MTTREQILERIKEVKRTSKAYQEKYGHEEEKTSESTICPSEEFLEELFERTARNLGFEYENPNNKKTE